MHCWPAVQLTCQTAGDVGGHRDELARHLVARLHVVVVVRIVERIGGVNGLPVLLRGPERPQVALSSFGGDAWAT